MELSSGVGACSSLSSLMTGEGERDGKGRLSGAAGVDGSPFTPSASARALPLSLRAREPRAVGRSSSDESDKTRLDVSLVPPELSLELPSSPCTSAAAAGGAVGAGADVAASSAAEDEDDSLSLSSPASDEDDEKLRDGERAPRLRFLWRLRLLLPAAAAAAMFVARVEISRVTAHHLRICRQSQLFVACLSC